MLQFQVHWFNPFIHFNAILVPNPISCFTSELILPVFGVQSHWKFTKNLLVLTIISPSIIDPDPHVPISLLILPKKNRWDPTTSQALQALGRGGGRQCRDLRRWSGIPLVQNPIFENGWELGLPPWLEDISICDVWLYDVWEFWDVIWNIYIQFYLHIYIYMYNQQDDMIIWDVEKCWNLWLGWTLFRKPP